jgi:hypothetical protein
VDDALAGDRHARTFLAHYLIGRPMQAVELPDSDSGHLSEADLVMVVVDVLNAEPNGIEIKVKLAAALQRLEKARDLREQAQLESRWPAAPSSRGPLVSAPMGTLALYARHVAGLTRG